VIILSTVEAEVVVLHALRSRWAILNDVTVLEATQALELLLAFAF